MDKQKIYTTLKRIFGFDSFRDNQEAIINAIIHKKDVFGVMPTGAGKSLCYQLPAILFEGTIVVVSPLIALMKDQVDSAKHAGIRADFINSSQSYQENNHVISRLLDNTLDLLYVAPERFTIPQFTSILNQANIELFAIDEAHCISEWGHDFRPDYLILTNTLKQFPGVPVAAFTATATQLVQNDIISKLALRDPLMIRASFNRPNLYYQVISKNNTKQQLYDFIISHKDEAGIIYRTSRKAVEETTQFLLENNIKALPYHAGLSNEERAQNQEKFNRDQVQVIVATIAFGMGIDKSNIRFVIHADLPKNLEGYYQETGRAGRDGEQAHCLLLFGRGDVPKLRYFIDQIENDVEQNNAFTKLNDMVNYAARPICRRKELLRYFNESYSQDNCGMCDICNEDIVSIDATREAQIFLSAIARTGQRFGAAHIIDIVTGANTKKIRSNQHDKIKTYGTGKDKSKKYWRALTDNLLLQQFVDQTNDNFPLLTITDQGIKLLKDEVTCSMLQRQNQTKEHETETDPVYNKELFYVLRKLRKEQADKEGVAPFIIFSDKTLHDMSRLLPKTESEFLMVHGVGERKLSLYGTVFIKEIAKFIEENDLQIPPANVQIQVKQQKTNTQSGTRETTRVLLNKGLSYKQIANQRELTPGTILSHMEQLKGEGESIERDNHISAEKFEEIKSLFLECNTTRLQPVVEKSQFSISYEEARLARIFIENTVA